MNKKKKTGEKEKKNTPHIYIMEMQYMGRLFVCLFAFTGDKGSRSRARPYRGPYHHGPMVSCRVIFFFVDMENRELLVNDMARLIAPFGNLWTGR